MPSDNNPLKHFIDAWLEENFAIGQDEQVEEHDEDIQDV